MTYTEEVECGIEQVLESYMNPSVSVLIRKELFLVSC